MIREFVLLDPTGHCYFKSLYQTWEMYQPYLKHRNKHRKTAKMRRQRNMAQMKEQIKTPEKDLNKMETSKPLDAEFKTLSSQ